MQWFGMDSYKFFTSWPAFWFCWVKNVGTHINAILITAELSQRKLAGAKYKVGSDSKLGKSGNGHRQVVETDSDHKFLMAMTGKLFWKNGCLTYCICGM